jgi:hypothetical protein
LPEVDIFNQKRGNIFPLYTIVIKALSDREVVNFLKDLEALKASPLQVLPVIGMGDRDQGFGPLP